jgi:hypothetical protein
MTMRGITQKSGWREFLSAIQLQFTTNTPILADYIWVGGGGVGLIIVIVIIVLVLRR